MGQVLYPRTLVATTMVLAPMGGAMTAPRQVIPGRMYLITRRCTRREFLLRPSKRTDEAFLYCLGVACRRYGMKLCWLTVMSNHYHAGIQDVDGCYPEFLRYFHSLLARCLNAHHGRWENLWASEQTCVVHLGDADAVFDKMVYSLCNAVKDHLVDRVHLWPGFCSYSSQLADRPVVVKRPAWFFDESGDMPEQVELHFARPPEFADLSSAQWVEKLRAAVAEEEAKAAAERQADGRRVLGRKAIRRQSPFACPKTCADRRVLRPRVASKNKWRRIELLTRNKWFLQRYREAYARRRAGESDVLFPHGSYKLRVQGLVRCEPPPCG
ncbi:MAG: hypothetical protein R3B13_36785 [Polyangiaceae bacterium]